MKKRWVEKKKKEQEAKRDAVIFEICERLEKANFLEDEELKSIFEAMHENVRFGMCFLPTSEVWEKRKEMYGDDNKKKGEFAFKLLVAEKDVKPLIKELMEYRRDYDRYLDSEPMEFDGDIIITDPCYFIKDEDWGRSDYGEDVEELGLIHYMARDTIYGDWSCSVFDAESKEVIGRFCADAGMVAVVSLDEVLKYNPEFNYHIEKEWTTALIKDFKGIVQFEVKHYSYFFGGKKCWDFDVRVIGKGINKKTGEKMNFVAKQTGL